MIKMTKNKRFYYDFEDPNGHKIMDIQQGNNFPLETVGDFRNIVNVMNGLDGIVKSLTEDYEQLSKENNEFKKENEQLKREINMLKTTIGRNEVYIQRMKYGGEWR